MEKCLLKVSTCTLAWLLINASAWAQTPTSFPTYIMGQPQAATPCAAGDVFPVIENGTTHNVAGNVVCSSLAGVVPTMANTGFNGFTTNPGGPAYTIKDTSVGIVISGPDQQQDALNASCKATPSPPFTISARVIVNTNAAENSDSGGGLAWRDSTTDKWQTYYLLAFPTNNQNAAAVYDIDFRNASNVIISGIGHAYISNQAIWQQFQDDGTNIYENVSQDGVNYLTVASIAKSAGYLGASGYNQVCFFASGHGAKVKVTLNQYIQAAGATPP